MKTSHRHVPRTAIGALVGPAVALLGTSLCASFAAAAPPAQIVITGEKIFPESMTSAPDGSVFIGSIGQHAIYRAERESAHADVWIQPNTDGLASVFGVFADAKSNTLYACSGTAPFGPPPAGAGPPPPSSLHLFDLKSGTPKGNYVFPTPGALCNDIAVDAKGNAYATDTVNMEVVRLKKGAASLEIWAGNGAFGPRGGVLDGISVLGERVLVNALGTSKLWSVPIEADGRSGTVTQIKLDRLISRPDGMRSFGRNKLLLVEGGDGGRLSKITLKGDSGKVETLQEGYPDGPVAVTVVGSTAYVVEGQLAVLMGRPNAPAAAPPVPAKPFKATSVKVGRP